MDSFAIKRVKVCLLTYFLILCTTISVHADLINLGHWSRAEIEQIVSSKNSFNSPNEQIVWLSSLFLKAPYAANTLIGGPREAEQLVFDLGQFDCFTYLDAIEALRRAHNFNDLFEQLKKVRYVDGVVTYTSRRHFFSDWLTGDGDVEDVTAVVGGDKTLSVLKQLNGKDDGSLWLPGIALESRRINYIRTVDVDFEVLNNLLAGDYVGVYTNHAGLDVSHTGIIIKKEGKVFMRHASSRNETSKVVDEDLLTYLQGKPGLVVYRVKP